MTGDLAARPANVDDGVGDSIRPAAGSPPRIVHATSVSVIIPTIGRPALFDAVSSVLAQTSQVREIIVAADTAGPLALPADERIRVIRTGPGAGGNVARQQGIEIARGEVIALLDDDDLWLPKKIEQQLRLLNFQLSTPGARATSCWVLGCSVLAITGADAPEIWPYRVIRSDEDVAEYIFGRHDLRRGHGFLQASGLVFPRELALQVPFRPQLRFHQDVTWLLDVTSSRPDVLIIQSQQPLLRYTVGSCSVSKSIGSQQSIRWAREYLPGRSARAVGDFLATVPVHYARREQSPGNAVRALVAAYTLGRPSWRAGAYALLCLLVTIPEVIFAKALSLLQGFSRRRPADGQRGDVVDAGD